MEPPSGMKVVHPGFYSSLLPASYFLLSPSYFLLPTSY